MSADETRPVVCPRCGQTIIYIRATTVQESRVVAVCHCSKLLSGEPEALR